MARSDWKPHPAPKPESITACARRYHACAVALAQTFGLSVAEVLTQHRESVTAIFIETSKAGVRLPARVTLAPLTAPEHQGASVSDPEARADHQPPMVAEPSGQGEDVSSLPTTIPADGDLPCAGQEIATLKPAALAMLISKTATLAHVDGAGWAPLLHALQAERQRRIARGQRRPTPRLVPKSETQEG